MAKFVVVADAVTVGVGEPNSRGVIQYTRVVKGRRIEGDPKTSPRLAHLLRRKAIVEVKSKEEEAKAQGQRHRTAKELSQAQGAPDDPVQAPDEDVAPLSAPLPDTQPPAIVSAGQPDLSDE